jgi:hypothetical protein
VEGGVVEGEQVKGGSGDGPGFGGVFPVEFGHGLWGEHIRVFYPLVADMNQRNMNKYVTRSVFKF